MNCPKCQAIMEKITFKGLAVERCTQCEGIWFAGADHKALKKMEGSQSLDTGSEEIGGQFDHMENVPCPVCRETMKRIPDTFQPHIHYDACPIGHGVFFDAGEFKDFKEETLGDFFKSLSWLFPKKG